MDSIFKRMLSRFDPTREVGGMIEAVGNPNPAQSGEGANGEVLDLSPQYGPAGSAALTLKQSDIPAINNAESVIKFVKKLRNQTHVRTNLMKLAEQIVQGFRIKGSPEVQAWFLRADVYTTVQRIAFELFSLGWCVVYVSEDKKGLPTLKVLHNVTVKRGLDGTPHVWLQLDDTVKQAIARDPKPFPKYWQQQLENSSGIDITRVYDGKGMRLKQGGAYFITLPTEPEDVYPVPPLYALARHIIGAERLLVNVDALTENMATVLTHIKVGNAEGQDMRSGKPKQVEKDRTTKLGEAFNTAKTKGTIITSGDVNIETVVPATNPYTHNMTTARESRALVQEGLGLPDFQNVPSEGAAAFLARSFFPTIDTVRHGIIQQGFLKVLLLDIADRVSGADKARIIWSLDSIVPLSDKLNIAKFRWTTGGMSIQEINEHFDPDYEFEGSMELKKGEQKFSDVVPLLWEPSQGLSDAARQLEQDKQKQQEKVQKQQPQNPSTTPGDPKQTVSPKAPGTAENPGAGRPKTP